MGCEDRWQVGLLALWLCEFVFTTFPLESLPVPLAQLWGKVPISAIPLLQGDALSSANGIFN